LGTGESVVLKVWSETLKINNTGNITFPSNWRSGSVLLNFGDTITLTKNDLVGDWWITAVGRSQRYLEAAPASGTWETGDYVAKLSPSVGASTGWVCTAGGTPGTWVSVGTLTQPVIINNSGAADVATLVTDFNSLLAKLRTAGVFAP
jgi:hypothetical protein